MKSFGSPNNDLDEIEFAVAAKEQTNKFSLVTEEATERRQIHIIDEITESSFELIKNVFDEMLEDDATKPIHIVMGSPGGDVKSMLGIMNLFLLSPVPCYTYLLSETSSAGSWIYLCGSKRFAPKTDLVSFMLHPMEITNSDSFGNHIVHNGYIEKLSGRLAEFTAKRTNIPIKRLRKLATIETGYFVGEELFTSGIATDELTTSGFWLQPKVENKKKKHSTTLIENKLCQ